MASEIMHREMVRAFEISFPGAPTKDLLKVKGSRNWREAKEDTNPEEHPDATEQTPTSAFPGDDNTLETKYFISQAFRR